MTSLKFEVRQILKRMSLGMLLICIGAYILGRGSALSGLALGFTTGLIYFLFLYYQIEKIAGLPKEKAIGYMRWGWIIRFAVLISMLILIGSSKINISAAIIGFFSFPVALFIMALALVVQQIRENK